MSTPLISVVTSVFNGERYLRESIESVLAQGGVDFEFIVIDDGSMDKSASILDNYTSADSRMKVIHQSNAGLTRALITGCAEARGEFIVRHDSDDISMPGRLHAQAGRLQADPRLAMVSCWTAALGPGDEELFETQRSEEPVQATKGLKDLWEGPPGHGSVMFRTEAYHRAGGYRPEFYFAQDTDLWLRLVEQGLIGYCPQLLYAYRISAASISSASRGLQTRYGHLARECAERRWRGDSESDVLARVAKLRDAPIERRNLGESEGNYFIGRCLLKRDDVRCRPYLRRALGLSSTGFKAAVGLVQSVALDFRKRSVLEPGPCLQVEPLKVLMVAAVDPNPDSGASGTEFQTAGALRRTGCVVDNVWAKDLRRHVRHGNLYSLLEQPRAYRNAVRSRFRKESYDVIHANQPQSFLVARDVHRRFPPAIVIHRSHGLESRVREVVGLWRRRWNMPRHGFPKSIFSVALQRLLDRQVRLAARYCDGTIVSSSSDRDYLVSRYGVSVDRVAVIPQAPPDSYREAPIADRAGRATLGVLYVGQFEFVKGSVTLIQIFRQLARNEAGARLTCVTAPRRFEEIRTLLGSEAARLGLISQIDQDELCQIYDNHDIFIFPSLFEGFGKAFLEAMSRGLAVVASDEGGMHDIIRDGDNGYLVPAGEPAAFVDRVERLLNDDALRMRISHAARATAIGYTWDRVARETVAFYQHLHQLRVRGNVAEGAVQ